MSEFWKSTPKYWCKHCLCYVRDTKLERQNHEATGKHQGALKRFLRDLHRGHEREERDKERARHEIARLNGVVSGSASSEASGSAGRNGPPAKPAEVQLQTQREQLAALGVAMPSDLRPEMAMPGEWTVTSTRVIETSNKQGDSEAKVEARASGVRKREETEERRDEEEAVRGLFKKAKRWGRDSKTAPTEEDQELDALLSGTIPLKLAPADEKSDIKAEEEDKKSIDVKSEIKGEDVIKAEPDTDSQGLTENPPATGELTSDTPIKTEGADQAGPGPVVFKKRKPKGLRSK